MIAIAWPSMTPSSPHLVHRDDVAQAHAQVLADDLVHADLGFVHGVVGQDDANGVLALLALSTSWGSTTSWAWQALLALGRPP